MTSPDNKTKWVFIYQTPDKQVNKWKKSESLDLNVLLSKMNGYNPGKLNRILTVNQGQM